VEYGPENGPAEVSVVATEVLVMELDQVRQRIVHSMKSATPFVDAMIMFMREFKALASANMADVLRTILNPPQLEQYGDPVIPQYVYDAIAKLDRLNSMRRGHQQEIP
jgi:ubiquitin carboxyl-terminal hydrolase 10